MPNEKIDEDAEVAAQYWKALVEKGIPPNEASYLTHMYVVSRNLGQEPKQPWERGP